MEARHKEKKDAEIKDDDIDDQLELSPLKRSWGKQSLPSMFPDYAELSQEDMWRITEEKKTKFDEKETWSHGYFGCLDDFRLCVCTFFFPCFTIGMNAAFFGDDACTTGCAYGLGCVALGPVLRWRIRMKDNLAGNMVTDVLFHTCCPCCALMQDNKQLYGENMFHGGERSPLVQDVKRK